MAKPHPAPRPRTFSEKLASRPRARFFTVFTILGFAVTPAALAIILVRRFQREEPPTGVESGVPVEVVMAAVLIALHLLCAFFAWHFWREEAAKEAADDTGRQEGAEPASPADLP